MREKRQQREHYELIEPRPIYDATGKVVLMEALDPEGYFPYYYFPGDVGRALAKSYGDRESFYAWLARGVWPRARCCSSIHLSSSSASTDPGPAQAW